MGEYKTLLKPDTLYCPIRCANRLTYLSQVKRSWPCQGLLFHFSFKKANTQTHSFYLDPNYPA